jgi:exodeoxyribonuclease-3
MNLASATGGFAGGALSPSAVRRLRAAGVDRGVHGWEKASDHAPAWIELADAGER